MAELDIAARAATLADVPRLVELMVEFYGEAGYPLDRARAAAAFVELVADPALGGVWLLDAAGETAGYVALTIAFSLEYGGRAGFLDDLFVRPAHRRRGLGSLALATTLAACAERGLCAIHLETGAGETPAQALYRRAGFVESGRQLLTLRLRDRLHET